MERLVQLPVFSWLFFRAYASEAHVSWQPIILGRIIDPDLTFVGPGVVIGSKASLVAHSVTFDQQRTLLYQSAPIRVGPRVTIGGGAQIEMGVTVGADALIEPLSRVLPFTRIPEGEVWGGNPARFLRKVEWFQPKVQAPPVQETIDESTARELVASALGIDPDSVTAEAADVEEWNSMGLMAIDAALNERYGLVVGPERIGALTSLAGITELIRGAASPNSSAATSSQAMPADSTAQR